MDIHSVISPLLIIATVYLFVVRIRKEDSAITEVFVAITSGAFILLSVTVFVSIMIIIIFDVKLNIDPYITPRLAIIYLQYYFTFVYYVVVILSMRNSDK